jgi:tRNA(fMet)-specific endonuclease VapC
MRYLLDTNICIYIIKQQPEKVFRRFRRIAVGQVGISSITWSELYCGVKKSRKVEQNEAALRQFVAPLEILPYPEEAAAVYGEIRAHLETTGQAIGPLDTFIAAHARCLDLILVSNNLGEFRRVPHLKTANWA